MEVSQANASTGGVSVGIGDQLIEASSTVRATADSSFAFCTDPMVQFATSSHGVSNCYVFKSRLQEYAQRVGLPTPVYETIKEGPSHEPFFRSTVIVGGARYESLPGFFNRKAAEQSAAEVALLELSKSGDSKDSITVPVHETGLCKNLLQEYAQKMNYAIPTYICRRDDSNGRTPLFSCTVEIGGIQYIGAAVRTKKEAEIKAARTALLAIRSSGTDGSQNLDGKPQYTVVPSKRKIPETAPPQTDSVKVKKPKKSRFRKKSLNRTPCDQNGVIGVLLNNDIATDVSGILQLENGSSDALVPNHEQKSDALVPNHEQKPDSLHQDNVPLKSNNVNGDNGEASVSEDAVQVGVVESSQTLASVSSCQPDSSKNHDDGNHIPASNASPSVQSGAVLPDSCIVQENSGVVPDTSHDCDRNNDEVVGKVTTVVRDAPISGQLDALPIDSEVSQEDETTAVKIGSHLEGENHACTNILTD